MRTLFKASITCGWATALLVDALGLHYGSLLIDTIIAPVGVVRGWIMLYTVIHAFVPM